MPEAIELRRKLVEWTKVTTIFKDLLTKDILKVYEQLGAALVRADSLLEIPHTKEQNDWYNKAQKAIDGCASARIEQPAKDALYVLDKDQMVAMAAEAGKVGYKSATIEKIQEYLKMPETKFVQEQLKRAVELKDPIRKANREIALIEMYLENNKDLFSFEAFARLRHPIDFANQKLLTMNRQELADGMLKWTTSPLHTSLVKLDGPLVKDAKMIHKSILGFMQDRKYANTDELASSILSYGINTPALREEIYSQLIKQLTNNPNDLSIKLGWLLMWICVSSFPSGDQMENFLLIFIKKHAPPGEVNFYLQIALKFNDCF